MPTMQTRRRFLTTLSLAGAASLARTPRAPAAEEGALETTSVRLGKIGSICIAPQHIAEELLRAEGFTDIRYVDTPTDAIAPAIGRGDVHFSMAAAFDHIQAIHAGVPIVVIAGIQVAPLSVESWMPVTLLLVSIWLARIMNEGDPWPVYVPVSDSVCAVKITPTSASPCETSYEMSCAAPRIAPRNEYFEPEDQPPSMIP